MDTVDGTNVDTCGVLRANARFSNDVRHADVLETNQGLCPSHRSSALGWLSVSPGALRALRTLRGTPRRTPRQRAAQRSGESRLATEEYNSAPGRRSLGRRSAAREGGA